MNSLRDLGYDFASAVADLVDNSIEAGSTVIAIDVEFEGDDSWVRIADNGCGMTHDQLREALRSGPPRHFFLSFLRFSIVTNYCTYTLYLLMITKATTNIVEICENVPQKPRFSLNAGFAIRPSPPILMRWPWGFKRSNTFARFLRRNVSLSRRARHAGTVLNPSGSPGSMRALRCWPRGFPSAVTSRRPSEPRPRGQLECT